MRQKNNTEKIVLFFLLTIIAILLVNYSLSANTPEGPTNITSITSSSKDIESVKNTSAIAGNLTQLNIFARTQTRTWQGYYGNITGTITLEDSLGNTFYDWENINPSGQIFASSNESIDFGDGNIECYNFSKPDASYLSLKEYEVLLGLSNTSADGINETFNETTEYDPFYVSTTYINSPCPTAYLHNASGQSSKDTFQEVLLYDKTAEAVIFTAIIEQNGLLGFNNQTWDFQMIVAENGHLGNDQATTYYFFVSLE